MRKFWQNPFVKIGFLTVLAMIVGYFLDNVALFAGIGFSLGLCYFYILSKNE